MDESYYRHTTGWLGKWAWLYNFIALPLTGIRNKVSGMIDSKVKIKILDVCTGDTGICICEKGFDVVGLDFMNSRI